MNRMDIEQEIINSLDKARQQLDEIVQDTAASIQNIKRMHDPNTGISDMLTDIAQGLPDVIFHIVQAIGCLPEWQKAREKELTSE